MSRVAGIFWNEISAIFLSCVAVFFLHYFFNLSGSNLYFISASMIILIPVFAMILYHLFIQDVIRPIDFSLYASYVIAFTAFYPFYIRIAENTAFTISMAIISFFGVGAFSWIAGYSEKSTGYAKRIAGSLMLEAVILTFVIGLLFVSWIYSLLCGIIGIAAMAGIMFIPRDIGDIKPDLGSPLGSRS